MKANIYLLHISPLAYPARPITRARAAYLMRAARSRRSGNITRIHQRYEINDCSYLIVKA